MNKACFEHIFFLLFRHNKFKKDKICFNITPLHQKRVYGIDRLITQYENDRMR